MSNGGKSRKSKQDSRESQGEIKMKEWSGIEPIDRQFPGPRRADSPLRIAFERIAYADVVSHAKESLNAEICGVLAGRVCEDDEGVFVHVEAALRGAAAKESTARVTFTQETWNLVHRTLEEEYPKLIMVGWYHSHPGFGVEFSDMDVFIQQNFFPDETQIALVTDPLGGDVAICRNTKDGIRYLDRFWVDGREHSCCRPKALPAQALPEASTGALPPSTIEERLNQVLTELDDLRQWNFRFLAAAFITVCLGVAAFVGWTIYSSLQARSEPPKINGYLPIPVQVGDKKVVIGIGILGWDIPRDLDPVYLEAEKARQPALAKEGKPDGLSNLPPIPPITPSLTPGDKPPAANSSISISVPPTQPAAATPISANSTPVAPILQPSPATPPPAAPTPQPAPATPLSSPAPPPTPPTERSSEPQPK